MPSTQPKSWGKVDKAALYKLIVDGEVDIEDLTYENIDAVHERWFRHRTQRNFRRNFRDFASSFDLEQALAGARQREAQGKIRVCVFFLC
jgi:hypothetical protein